MSYTLNLEQLSAEHIAFGYSPAHETLLSLHVLLDCKHHPLHIPFVRQARKKMSAALKEEIDAFGFLYNRPVATFWDLSSRSLFRPFSEELQEFAASPVSVFVEESVKLLLGRKVELADLTGASNLSQEVLNVTETRYPKSVTTVRELLNQPEKLKERFVSFLAAYWETTMATEWPRLEELFMQDIAFRGRKLMRQGAHAVLDRLSPEVALDAEKKRAVIRRPSQAEIELLPDDVLYLSPSYFVWPHLFVKLDKPIILNYSVTELQEGGRPPVPPENLLKMFRALGDMTRMQLVQLLAERARSTRELAGLIGVTDAAISKHLKLLQEAGIVSSQRDSYYVLYQLNEVSFSELKYGLDQLLDSVSGDTDDVDR